MSTTEFRDFADECMDWASTARSDRERKIFLQMAQTWLWATDRADGKSTLEFPAIAWDNRSWRNFCVP